MAHSSTQKHRYQTLNSVLVGGALLALVALIAAATEPAGPWICTLVAQEPAAVAGFALTEESGVWRDSEPDFGLSVYPSKRLVRRGFTASYTISVTASSGFASEVSLDMEPFSGWIEDRLDPGSLVPPGDATLTLTTTLEAIAGTHRLTVTGSADGLTHMVPLTLTVLANETFLPVVARGCDFACTWDEPNDERSEAISLQLGSEYLSFICPGDPRDYFSVTLDSPTTLILCLTNLTNMPPDVDYDLYLFNADGDLIARSDAYGQVNERIEYDIVQPGKYYILVYPYSGSSREVPYVLTVQTDS